MVDDMARLIISDRVCAKIDRSPEEQRLLFGTSASETSLAGSLTAALVDEGPPSWVNCRPRLETLKSGGPDKGALGLGFRVLPSVAHGTNLLSLISVLRNGGGQLVGWARQEQLGIQTTTGEGLASRSKFAKFMPSYKYTFGTPLHLGPAQYELPKKYASTEAGKTRHYHGKPQPETGCLASSVGVVLVGMLVERHPGLSAELNESLFKSDTAIKQMRAAWKKPKDKNWREVQLAQTDTEIRENFDRVQVIGDRINVYVVFVEPEHVELVRTLVKVFEEEGEGSIADVDILPMDLLSAYNCAVVEAAKAPSLAENEHGRDIEPSVVMDSL